MLRGETGDLGVISTQLEVMPFAIQAEDEITRRVDDIAKQPINRKGRKDRATQAKELVTRHLEYPRRVWTDAPFAIDRIARLRAPAPSHRKNDRQNFPTAQFCIVLFREHSVSHRRAALVGIERDQMERALIGVYPRQTRHEALGQHGGMLSRR